MHQSEKYTVTSKSVKLREKIQI